MRSEMGPLYQLLAFACVLYGILVFIHVKRVFVIENRECS